MPGVGINGYEATVARFHLGDSCKVYGVDPYALIDFAVAQVNI